jgi:L-lactate dehydrogenase complex protein LldF
VVPAADALADRAAVALGDGQLRRALDHATARFGTARRAAFAGLPASDAVRDRARAIKDRTLAALDEHLGRLVAEVERAGGVVHFARDAAEARAVVVELARARGARVVAKSKSMATEEIHLNEALEAAGVTVVETDLGEYVVQLARERPSHIIVPAIHKTARQVADLLARTTGAEVAADAEAVTALARRQLRARFLEADMGVTGVNFAAADSGTLVLVTNEGNGRLVTTLPRVHVAVMGVDKVIPSLADLPPFLELLPRSATGQTLTTYVNLVRGPRGREEADGPDELHLVLLDGGRVGQVAGPLREALACLRCGACLNVCPVYREIGGHAYGHTYPGPIGILLTTMLEGTRAAADLAHASTLCGACLEVCPVRIDIPRMLIESREAVARAGLAPGQERRLVRVLAAVLERPRMLRALVRLGRPLERLARRGDGTLRVAPAPLAGWTAHRALPRLAARTFSERWEARRGGAPDPRP